MTYIKKKFRLIILTAIFIMISPIVILYATGDILGSGWSLLKTGGIYVAGAPAGSDIFMNSKKIDTTSFFNKNIFIKNLRKGTYSISVKKNGYYTWSKKLVVTDSLVSDANVFMLPTESDLRRVLRYLDTKSGEATSTWTNEKNPEYIDISDLFLKKPVWGTKTNPIMDGKIGLWIEGTIIYSKWFGNSDLAPRYFCEIDNCTKTIQVIDIGYKPTRINLLPEYSGVVVIASGSRVYAIQIEKNPQKISQTIYRGDSPDFRISNGSLYIKDGLYIAEVLL